MPRYYFHIRNADDMARDEEGTDLPDLDSARKAALACARELSAIADKEGADRIGPRQGERHDIRPTPSQTRGGAADPGIEG